jgi:hypothetical protein
MMTTTTGVEVEVVWSGGELMPRYPWASTLHGAIFYAPYEPTVDDKPTRHSRPCACGCGGYSQRGLYCQGHHPRARS